MVRRSSDRNGKKIFRSEACVHSSLCCVHSLEVPAATRVDMMARPTGAATGAGALHARQVNRSQCDRGCCAKASGPAVSRVRDLARGPGDFALLRQLPRSPKAGRNRTWHASLTLPGE
jgi:hypothetical protein